MSTEDKCVSLSDSSLIYIAKFLSAVHLSSINTPLHLQLQHIYPQECQSTVFSMLISMKQMPHIMRINLTTNFNQTGQQMWWIRIPVYMSRKVEYDFYTDEFHATHYSVAVYIFYAKFHPSRTQGKKRAKFSLARVGKCGSMHRFS